jgi:E3 ubiquitin-protein ligase NEDD4
VKPAEHKLVLQVFDENRLTRDDFLGMVELPLLNLPKEQEGRTIPSKQYILRPRRLALSILYALKLDSLLNGN